MLNTSGNGQHQALEFVQEIGRRTTSITGWHPRGHLHISATVCDITQYRGWTRSLSSTRSQPASRCNPLYLLLLMSSSVLLCACWPFETNQCVCNSLIEQYLHFFYYSQEGNRSKERYTNKKYKYWLTQGKQCVYEGHYRRNLQQIKTI